MARVAMVDVIYREGGFASFHEPRFTRRKYVLAGAEEVRALE
jgi:hypothetical protein